MINTGCTLNCFNVGCHCYFNRHLDNENINDRNHLQKSAHVVQKMSTNSTTTTDEGSLVIDECSSDSSSINSVLWLIVHYPNSDPGNGYEIVDDSELIGMNCLIKKGSVVNVQKGSARIRAITVTISDDFAELQSNFDAIVEEHEREQMQKLALKRKHRYGGACETPKRRRERVDYEYRQKMVKFIHTGTQTDPEQQPLGSESANDKAAYLRLKGQYEKLQSEYNRMFTVISAVKSGLKENVSSLDGITNEPLRCCNENLALWNSSTNNKHSIKKILQNSTIENVEEDFDKMVQIGSGGTTIRKSVYDSISWSNHSSATRNLLSALFTRDTLATQSLTGKPSPAFMSTNKKGKVRLDPTIISDIIEIVTKKCMVSPSIVRGCITTKCADENKMYKRKLAEKNDKAASATITRTSESDKTITSNNKENNPKGMKQESHHNSL